MDESTIRLSLQDDKLLFIRFTSQWCKEGLLFDNELAEDFRLRDFLSKQMIPVNVDVTRQPHFFKLYSVGYFPDDIIRNVEGTFILSRQKLDNPTLREFINFAQQLYREGRKYKHSSGSPDSRSFHQGVNSETLLQLPGNLNALKEAIVDLILSHFDRLNGGFGTAPKYPNSAILETLFYLYHRSADEVLLYQVILKTLSSMYMGLVDSKDYGFVRCAYRADWGNPTPEKPLITQVEGINAFNTAFRITGNQAYLTVAKKTLDYVFQHLHSSSQGYFQSALTSIHPRTLVPTLKTMEELHSSIVPSYDPIIDPLHVISWNLQMIRCVLSLDTYLRIKEYKERVLTQLEIYMREHERHGFLMHVYREQQDAILLEDQVSFMEACRDAYDVTLDDRYIRAVFSMANLLLNRCFDSSLGLFKPILKERGGRILPHEEWYALEWNARIANVFFYIDELSKLIRSINDADLPDYRKLGMQVVEVMKFRYRYFDPSLAHYFFAIQHALQESIKIYLIGDRNEPKLCQFHELIMKKYEPMRIIIHVPPPLLDESSELLPTVREIDKEPVMVYFQYQDVQSPPMTTLRQLEIGLERIGMI